MSYDDILETGLFQSRKPDYSISDTPETAEPILGAYDYGQVDPYPGQGSLGADSSFLATPRSTNVQNVKDVPVQSWHQKLFAPTVKGNPASNPFVTGLSALANIYPQNHASVAANQRLFAQQVEQQQQQEVHELQKKQAEREIIRQGMDAVMAGRKIPGKAQRAAYYKLLKEKQEAFGGGLDGHIDMFQKADDEEAEATAAAYDEIFQANPEWGLQKYRELSKDPKMLEMVGELTAKHLKLKQERALGEALNRAVYGNTNTSQGTPEAPAAPSTSQTPAPSQGAPGQPQGIPYLQTPEGQKLQQHVIQRATELGLDPVKVQALIHQESRWNPLAKSPTGVEGLMQVTKATGNQYGQDPTRRTDPYQSANAGLNYLAALYKKFSGDWGKTLMAYNGGSDPNYVQNVTRHEKNYANGRPASQAAQSQGTDAEQKALQTNQQKLAALDAAIERVTPIVLQDSTGQSQKALQALQAQRQVVESNIKRIEDRYDKQKPTAETQRAFEKLYPGKSWHQATPEEKQRAINESSAIAAAEKAEQEKAALQATLPEKKELATAANQNNIITNPTKYRNTKAAGTGDLYATGMTEADIARENKETPGKWVPVVAMPEKDESNMRSNLEGVNAAQRALKLLDDDNVAKLIGHMFSNPTGSYQVALQKVFGSRVPDKYVELAAEIADLTSSIRHARIGGAQTVTETVNLQPMLPNLNDADVRTVRTKLRVLHNKLAEGFNASLRGHQKRGRDVNPEWQEIAALEAPKETEVTGGTPEKKKKYGPLGDWVK